MKTEKIQTVLHTLWRVLVILLVNAMILLMLTRGVSALSRYGSRGGEVTQIQQRLSQLGYDPGKADGIFGDRTLAAVKAFQRDYGLTVDGIAGKNTLAALGITGGGGSGGGYSGYSDSDIQLLASIISAESRGEPYTGQVAVGAVILNRIAHPSFPNTLAGVIYQNGAFSCLTDGGINGFRLSGRPGSYWGKRPYRRRDLLLQSGKDLQQMDALPAGGDGDRRTPVLRVT